MDDHTVSHAVNFNYRPPPPTAEPHSYPRMIWAELSHLTVLHQVCCCAEACADISVIRSACRCCSICSNSFLQLSVCGVVWTPSETASSAFTGHRPTISEEKWRHSPWNPSCRTIPKTQTRVSWSAVLTDGRLAPGHLQKPNNHLDGVAEALSGVVFIRIDQQVKSVRW